MGFFGPQLRVYIYTVSTEGVISLVALTSTAVERVLCVIHSKVGREGGREGETKLDMVANTRLLTEYIIYKQ